MDATYGRTFQIADDDAGGREATEHVNGTRHRFLNGLFNVLANSLGGAHVRLFFYPWWFILSVLALSMVVGFLGGIWPARRAAKMNPLEALRYKMIAQHHRPSPRSASPTGYMSP